MCEKCWIFQANLDPWNCFLWVADKNLENLQLIKQGEVNNIYSWQGDWNNAYDNIGTVLWANFVQGTGFSG